MQNVKEIIPKLDEFTTAYLVAALWSSTGCDEEFENLDDTYSIYDFAPEALTQAIKDCDEFRAEAGVLLADWVPSQAGNDFWLTRCGHGAGFWDRGMASGEALKDMVGYGTKYKSLDIYVGDDGKIYGMGETLQPQDPSQPVAS